LHVQVLPDFLEAGLTFRSLRVLSDLVLSGILLGMPGIAQPRGRVAAGADHGPRWMGLWVRPVAEAEIAIRRTSDATPPANGGSGIHAERPHRAGRPWAGRRSRS